MASFLMLFFFLPCLSRDSTWLLFASQDSETLLRRDQLLNECISPGGSHTIIQELIHVEKGGKYEDNWVASPESVTLYFKLSL